MGRRARCTLLLGVLVVLRIRVVHMMKYMDIGHPVGEKSVYWPNGIPVHIVPVAKGVTDKGFWYESYSFSMNEHTSTHLDAPSHFAKGVWTVDRIPFDHLVAAPGVVIDIQEKVAEDPQAELTAEDVTDWLAKHGPLPDRAIVLVRTGWASRYDNRTAFFGTNTNDTTKLVFPGINVGAARIFSGYEGENGRRVVGVGLETPSLDHGASTLFPTHVELAKANIFGLENLADLSELPTTGFHLTVMPMNIVGGSGAPARVFAAIPDPADAQVVACHAHNATPSLLFGPSLAFVFCLSLLVTALFRP